MINQLDAARFAQISAALLGEPDEALTLKQVLEHARSTVPGCEEASVTMKVGNGRVRTPASTATIATRADLLQYETDQGPCMSAVWDDRGTWLITDTATEQRWPQWAPAALELGVRSVLSVKLRFDERTLGGLNLYAQRPDAFGADSVDVAHVFATHAAAALAAARQLTSLAAATDSRHMIGMAQGRLIERFGLTEEQAFQVLRRYSQDSNIKLRDVAAELLAHGRLPGPPNSD